MSIRLNKAIRELNIGLQTAIAFLQKRTDLGNVRDDPSFKLNDQQYAALVEAFKKDAAVKERAEQLFRKPEEKIIERQKYTPLGKINLNTIDKTASHRTEEDYWDKIEGDNKERNDMDNQEAIMNFFFDNNSMIVLTIDNIPSPVTDVYGTYVAEGNTPDEAISNLEKLAKQTNRNANAILGLRLESKIISINNHTEAPITGFPDNCANVTIAYGTVVKIDTD